PARPPCEVGFTPPLAGEVGGEAAGWEVSIRLSAPVGSGTAIYALVLAARFRNRSTCPPVSTIRCVPVKNGWQTEQISVFSSLRVEPVVKVFPHAQVTTASAYKVG